MRGAQHRTGRRFPTTATIDGRVYKLNTDYRVGLRIMDAYEDAELLPVERAAIMVRLLFEEVPHNKQKAIELAAKFLNAGIEREQDEGTDAPRRRFYSWSKDAQWIYSAFRRSHNIDLDSIEHLHWWAFTYLFGDLSADSFICRLIDLRVRRDKGKLTKEEREFCSEHSAIIDLDNTADDDETNSARQRFLDLIKGKGGE